jgi:uncharacterized membrane protein YgdD (TMEM256/DUF423 family)
VVWTFWIVVGAISAAISVLMGAFGAHALKERIPAHLLEVFETAARYQMYHSLALIAVGLLSLRVDNLAIRIAGIAFIVGVLGFSGSLYGYVFTQNRSFAMVTPIGGLCFVAGWLLTAWAVIRIN